jgi:TolB protein
MRTFTMSLFLAACLCGQTPGPLGIFDGQTDVGNPEQKGSAAFDSARQEYRITSSGVNMWEKIDQFEFLWKKISGGAAITAAIRFPEPSATPHRKAVLMFRQAMETGAPYVDVAIHGSGLTAIQFRETADQITRSVQFPVEAPAWVRLERRGTTYTLFTSTDGKSFQEAGAIQVRLADPVYVGIGVCSHNPKMLETAVFSGVSIQPLAAPPAAKKK